MKVGDLVFWETKALSGYRIVIEVWNDKHMPCLLVKIPGQDGKTYPVMAMDCRLATEEEVAKVSDSLTDKKVEGEKKTVAQYLAEKEERLSAENNKKG